MRPSRANAATRMALAMATMALVGRLLAACKGASGAQIGEAATAVALAGAATAAAQAIRSTVPETSHLAAIGDEAVQTGPHPFDREHVHALLLEMDLNACWPAGVPRQPRDVQVTFTGNGTVSRVAVPRPLGLQTFDEACVAKALKDVIVDPFAGDEVILGVTYGER